MMIGFILGLLVMGLIWAAWEIYADVKYRGRFPWQKS